MTLAPARHLDAFAGLRVLVVGEAMLDSYLEGASARLCPEAPVPVVAVSGRRDAPGGAANTAANVRALGAAVSFLSVVGDDPEADSLRRCLAERGIGADGLLVQPGRRTLAKQRVCAAGQILVRFDQGDTRPMTPRSEARLVERLGDLFTSCDAVIVSDYGYGVLTPAVISALAGLQAHSPRVVVVDSKQPEAYRRLAPTAVKPNYAEAVRLLGLPEDGSPATRAERLVPYEARVLAATGARIVAVTLDCDGAILFERGRPPHRSYARPGPRACTSGAGDTFLTAVALSLAAGADTPEAAEIASAAAGVVVGKQGTSSCSAEELRACLAADGTPAGGRARLAADLAEHRRRGRRIVFTNGCFDILHKGHVSYLRRARELGDVLVVGVNSDASIRRLKGPTRPLNPLEDRLAVLAALRFVDHLVPFDEDTPHELIRLVRPDVFVKGGDYTRERLPEASLVEELGGVVRILPLVEDRSTTGLIARIHAQGQPAPSPLVNGHATS
jgi:D-beta-D-heptose 7-phosphate kinase/D-beta-D-heptose 1-phosphate adenosyltransferase